MFTVYGLRVRGDVAVRYIGQTSKRPADRLRVHVSESRLYGGWIKSIFFDWLRANHGNVEVFEISVHETRAEAWAAEKAMIATCVLLGQPLLNRNHFPASLRAAA